MSAVTVAHEHHADTPGDVYIEVGSWSSGDGQITVFARDVYTHCTATAKVSVVGDQYAPEFAAAVEAVMKAHFKALQDEITSNDGHSIPEHTEKV